MLLPTKTSLGSFNSDITDEKTKIQIKKKKKVSCIVLNSHGLMDGGTETVALRPRGEARSHTT